MDLTDDEIRAAIEVNVNKHWKKMVADSMRVAGANYDIYGDDLLAHCLSELFTKKPLAYQYQLIVVDDKLPNYIGRAMALEIKSSASPFFAKYRKFYFHMTANLSIDPDLEESFPYLTTQQEDLLTPKEHQTREDCMMHALEQLDFYHKRLVTEYYINGLSYNELHKKYNITLGSLKKDITKGIKLIRQYCDKHL